MIVAGAWPPPPPFGRDTPAALWLDGTLEAAVAAAWLTGCGRRWVGLMPRLMPPARSAAEAVAARAEAPLVSLETEADFLAPPGWAAAWEAGRAGGASWLVTGLAEAPGEPPVALRLHAAEQALGAWGLAGLWAPLLGVEALTIARWALAMGVPAHEAWDCQTEAACGVCAGCRSRSRRFRQLGMRDPLAL